jgi:hypothetical protein
MLRSSWSESSPYNLESQRGQTLLSTIISLVHDTKHWWEAPAKSCLPNESARPHIKIYNSIVTSIGGVCGPKSWPECLQNVGVSTSNPKGLHCLLQGKLYTLYCFSYHYSTVTYSGDTMLLRNLWRDLKRPTGCDVSAYLCWYAYEKAGQKTAVWDVPTVLLKARNLSNTADRPYFLWQPTQQVLICHLSRVPGFLSQLSAAGKAYRNLRRK